jgi:ATP-dependent protease ClpP protease subunit
MAENSLMMIHNPYTFAIGDETEMLRTAEMLAKVKSSIITSYVSKSGMAEDDLAAAMDIETWYTAKDAVAAGLADKIIEKEAVINRVKAPWIRNAPNIEKTPDRQPADYRIAARKRLKDIG